MRRAYNDNGLILIAEKFVGIALGYDYCSEHEWGIKRINEMFGIPKSNKDNMGVKNRTITKYSPIFFIEKKVNKINYALLYVGNEFYNDERNLLNPPSELNNFVKDLKANAKYNLNHIGDGKKDNIITAWDGKSFGVAVMGNVEVEYLRELYQAFKSGCNVTIAVANLRVNNPFSGSSLCLLITDKIPQETLDLMYYGDKEYYDLEEYEEKINMKKIIADFGNKNGYHGDKYFCACSPKWINYHNANVRNENKLKNNTNYDIIYWVNYSDDDNNYGWYCVEEILKWLTTPNLRLINLKKYNGT